MVPTGVCEHRPTNLWDAERKCRVVARCEVYELVRGPVARTLVDTPAQAAEELGAVSEGHDVDLRSGMDLDRKSARWSRGRRRYVGPSYPFTTPVPVLLGRAPRAWDRAQTPLSLGARDRARFYGRGAHVAFILTR